MATTKVSQPKFLTVKTQAKYLPVSARKLREVVVMVKGKLPEETVNILDFCNKKAARFLSKVVKTAIADSVNNFNLDKESLRFEEILVNEGPRLKRRDRSHGARFNGGLILKPRSHLTVKVLGRKTNG